MKKLLTKEEKEKKSRRNALLIGGVMIFLMLFSTAGYSIMNSGKTNNINYLDYKGVKFIKSDDSYWRFTYNGLDYVTRNNPEEVANISIKINDIDYKDFSNQVIYTAGEPDDNILLGNLYQIIKRHSRACIDYNCTENAPIKDCSSDVIIVINEAKEDEEERIYSDKKCIYITSSYTNLSKYIDALIYKIIGLN